MSCCCKNKLNLDDLNALLEKARRCVDCGRLVCDYELPKSEWVSVKTSLPEEGVRVLVCNANAPINEIWLDYIVNFDEGPQWACVRLDDESQSKATHWMPLPSPPKR